MRWIAVRAMHRCHSDDPTGLPKRSVWWPRSMDSVVCDWKSGVTMMTNANVFAGMTMCSMQMTAIGHHRVVACGVAVAATNVDSTVDRINPNCWFAIRCERWCVAFWRSERSRVQHWLPMRLSPMELLLSLFPIPNSSPGHLWHRPSHGFSAFRRHATTERFAPDAHLSHLCTWIRRQPSALAISHRALWRLDAGTDYRKTNSESMVNRQTAPFYGLLLNCHRKRASHQRTIRFAAADRTHSSNLTGNCSSAGKIAVDSVSFYRWQWCHCYCLHRRMSVHRSIAALSMPLGIASMAACVEMANDDEGGHRLSLATMGLHRRPDPHRMSTDWLASERSTTITVVWLIHEAMHANRTKRMCLALGFSMPATLAIVSLALSFRSSFDHNQRVSFLFRFGNSQMISHDKEKCTLNCFQLNRVN